MIRDWKEYLSSVKGYSPNTVMGYEKDVRSFMQWAKGNITHARWSTITLDDIDRYVIWMVGEGMKPATTNRHLSAISSVYKYLWRVGYEVEDPTRTESRRKIGRTMPNTIPVEELRAAYEHATGAARVMLGILISTGVRIQELLDMTWETIDFETGGIQIRGKGAKERTVQCSKIALKELNELRSWAPQAGRIFHFDQREARHIIFEALRPWSHAKQLSPHAIRHTMATHMAAEGCNVATIGTILGHNHLQTTQRYIDAAAIDARQAMTTHSIIN